MLRLARERQLEIGRTPKQNARMICEDCGSFSEPYMLVRELWETIHPEGRAGYVCLLCARMRIGRELSLRDFAPVLVNLPILVGYAIGTGRSLETTDARTPCTAPSS